MKISIPQPCHENWQEMTPNDQGRFCASCQKTVIDFTNWTDKELSQFLAKESKNVCGRFKNLQLSNDLLSASRRRKPWLHSVITLSIAYFVSKPTQVIAQVNNKDTACSNVAKTINTASICANDTALNMKSRIDGIILDQESHEPIIGSIVQLIDKHNNIIGGALSDIDGHFVISDVKPGCYKLVAKIRNVQN